MIYFFDENHRYIGCRALKDGEAIPTNATGIDPMVGNGEQASWNGTSWVLTDIPPNDQNIEPPAPTLEERVATVEEAALDLAELQSEMLYQLCLMELGVNANDL